MNTIADRGEINRIIELLRSYFAERAEVVLAFLFGSVARGQVGPLSDIDVAVLLPDAPDADACFDARLTLVGDLMQVLHTNAVDILILNQAPLTLRYAVLRDGVLLYMRDKEAYVTFRVRTLNEYFDFQPLVRMHQRIFFEKIRKGEFLSGHSPYRGTLTANKDS